MQHAVYCMILKQFHATVYMNVVYVTKIYDFKAALKHNIPCEESRKTKKMFTTKYNILCAIEISFSKNKGGNFYGLVKTYVWQRLLLAENAMNAQ